ncbi:MAG: nucleoside kinase [Bacteroidales bacterium]|nr:nucleoside kinase [Bacteroidales bacterium]
MDLTKEELIERVMNERSVAAINDALIGGAGREIIQYSETFHARQLTSIADQIASNVDCRLAVIAGPSSSGKTTTSKRLAVHLHLLGLRPVVLNMDNYFRNREDTPRDENGNYDFESLGAMDVELLNKQLRQLLAGEEVEIPTFDFNVGKRKYEGNRLKVSKGSVIIMEGIHGLNPELTPDIPKEEMFTIYASIIHSLSIDDANDTTYDTRLLRRMVRDQQFRAHRPEDTIMRWASVRAGEKRNIIPFMRHADAYFDSGLIYELPLLKSYTDNLLRSVPAESPAFGTAQRLLSFIMRRVTALTPKEVSFIATDSIVREFIGGSCFRY